MGAREGLDEAVALGVDHAELVEVDDRAVLVEDAHDHALAADERQRRDAQVDRGGRRSFSAMRPSCGMRRSAMSRSDMILMREMTPATMRLRGMRVASASTPSTRKRTTQLAADRLEVDVRRALVDALGDERVDELDDRRVVGGLAQVDDLGTLVGVTASSTTMSSIWFMRPMSAPMSSAAATAGRIS